MLTALWSGLGDKVAERWSALLLSPALVFWGGGLLAWVWTHGGFTGSASGWHALERTWRHTFVRPPVTVQIGLVVLALLVVAASARLAEVLTLPTLRFMEGYWPGWAAPVRGGLVRVRGLVIDRRIARWRNLARRRAGLSPREAAEYAKLSAWRAGVPPAPQDRMPTRLGDALRAMESRPRHRYGLDAVVCWPRLWLVMPDQARTEVGAARTRLDEAARLWLWALLFLVWAGFTWWAVPVAVIGMTIAYRIVTAAADTYGQLVQACFDLHRKHLYDALRRDMPTDPQQEHRAGVDLTRYLQRGPNLGAGTGGHA